MTDVEKVLCIIGFVGLFEMEKGNLKPRFRIRETTKRL
jgi:hypothetical protein